MNGEGEIDMDDLIDLTELHKVLQEYANDAAEIYKYQLALGAKPASRKLIDNVKSNVIVGERAYEVTLSLEHYWKYIEGGSKGTISSPPGAVYPAHFPPTWALEKWIRVKPVIPRPDETGRIPSPKQLAYLIGRKIEEEGIEPFPALQTTKEELDKIYHEKISAALGHDMTNYIAKVIAQ